jgi:hypothetical protein
MENKDNRIGEVVEATTTSFISQCYKLYNSPHLGSLIKTGGPYPTYGIVYNIITQGIDPSRKPVVRGINSSSEEEVYRLNPQLEHLLRTDFYSVSIGYIQGDNIIYHLPPAPPPIYSFVQKCDGLDLINFSSRLEFIKILCSSGIPALDEVISAFIRNLADSQQDKENFLINVGKELIYAFPGDFRKMESILQKVLS